MRLRAAALALAIPGVAFGLPAGKPERSGPAQTALSAPLWLIPPALLREGLGEENEPRRVPLSEPSEQVRDPVLQSSFPPLRALSTSLTFEGIGSGTIAVPSGGAFIVEGDPPDPVGDIGPNHYVQMVNSSLAVFSRAGTLLFGPVSTSTVFTALGGPCATGKGYDGVVLYDPLADRWLITQLAYLPQNASTGPFFECAAVSRTPDPTGQYSLYAFRYTNFNDYPKFGVWPDGYYVTYNMFVNASPTSSMLGRSICVFDRVSMIAGRPADQQCVAVTSDEVSGLTPADFDGQLPPPAGERESIVGYFRSDSLVIYRYHVDWDNAVNSAVDAVVIPAAPFQQLCNQFRRCIQQLNGPVLDALSDRMMFRIAYRNMGAYEALVANHNVVGNSGAAGSSSRAGVRWYEIRDPGGDAFVYQQGTYAPDANSRWMGSAAMDRAGNIGLGFSLSSDQQYVALGVTGRLATDPLGVMGQGETVISGGGAENDLGTGGRWGDYSSMSIDPVDDCTFWYTAEYIPVLGMRNWKTRVVSFQLPGCTTAPDFAVWLSPSRASMIEKGAATFTVFTAPLRTTAARKTIQLDVSDPGNGLHVTPPPPFAPITAGQTATFAVVSDGTSAIGESQFTLSATAEGVMLTAGAAVAVIDRDFAISVDKPSTTLSSIGTTDVLVFLTPLFGDPETVLFSASSLPRGVKAIFDPSFARVGTFTTLHLQGGQFILPATTNLKVTAVGSLVSHTAVIQLRTLFPPTVNILTPRPFTNISGVVRIAITAAVSPGTTLKSIQLYIDDQKLNGLASTHAPVDFPWDTNSVRDGPHSLTAQAIDSEGNATQSTGVAVWIENGGCGGCSSKNGGWEMLGLVLLMAARARPRWLRRRAR
jgi:hypothetical protein